MPSVQHASNELRTDNQRISLWVGLWDFLNFTSMYSLSFTTATQLMMEVGKFAMYPIAITMGLTSAILAWRQAQLEDFKSNMIIRAMVETGAAITITATLIGLLAVQAKFVFAAPIIFASLNSFRTLFNLGSALYYVGRSQFATTEEKKEKYKGMAKSSLVVAGLCLLMTISVTTVSILAKPFMAALGVITGVAGAAYMIYKLMALPSDDEMEQPSQDQTVVTDREIENHSAESTCKIQRDLRIENTDSPGRRSPLAMTSPVQTRKVTNDSRISLGLSPASQGYFSWFATQEKSNTNKIIFCQFQK